MPHSVKATNSYLPISCIGDDYLMWPNWNGDPSNGWGKTSVLNTLSQWHCTGARLLFTFSDCPGAGGSGAASTLSYTKLDAVLNYLNSVGVQAVLCDWSSDTVGGWYGSNGWRNDWVALAQHYKGDNRIKAFEIANEPYSQYLASNANTLNSFNAACASLIDQIRAVDPIRTIMYPIEVGIFTDNVNEFYNSLVSNGVTSKGNIIYDIVHPYYFENYPAFDPVNNPVGDAAWYWNNYVQPQISKFGAQNCWCGEIFCWPRSEGYNYNDQQAFVQAMINYFVSAGMGFQMLQFITSTDAQAQVDALTNSNYYTLINNGGSLPTPAPSVTPTPTPNQGGGGGGGYYPVATPKATPKVTPNGNVELSGNGGSNETLAALALVSVALVWLKTNNTRRHRRK